MLHAYFLVWKGCRYSGAEPVFPVLLTGRSGGAKLGATVGPPCHRLLSGAASPYSRPHEIVRARPHMSLSARIAQRSMQRWLLPHAHRLADAVRLCPWRTRSRQGVGRV